MDSSKLKKTINRWSEEINDEILELIIKKLNLVGRLRFKVVCKSWRRALMGRYLPPAPELPWLMLSSSPSSESLNFLHLCGEKKIYEIKVPEARGSWCCGSSEGWLVMADVDKGNFLLNPFSRTTILLPHQATIPHSQTFRENILDPRFIRKAILSYAPTASDANCIVVAIDGFGELFYCRPGDNSWKPLESGLKQSIYDDIIFYNGQLHAMTYKDELKVFSSVGPDSCVILHEKLLRVGLQSRHGGLHFHETIYLVESDHKLLMVVRVLISSQGDAINKYQFEVFELVLGGKQLFPVKSLGDQMLFLGKNCSASFKAAADYHWGNGGNCIYFTDDSLSGMYQLEDQTLWPLPTKPSPGVRPPIWITPDPSMDRMTGNV